MLLVICTACDVREDLPAVEQTLPAGFKEKVVPQQFVDEVFKVRKDAAWMRCFDADMDWQELNRHFATSLQSLNYTDHTSEWVPVFAKDSNLSAADCRAFVSVYSSPSDFGHVFLFNLEFIRNNGGTRFATSGDYLALCGYDNTTKKQVLGSN